MTLHELSPVSAKNISNKEHMLRRRPLPLPVPPVGCRFLPTEEELIHYFLERKVMEGHDLHKRDIVDLDIYKFSPSQLYEKYKRKDETKNMFFFVKRSIKYLNGTRPNRIAANGYWKATSHHVVRSDKIGQRKGIIIGYKKVLVYYYSNHSRQNTIKSNWIMHEFTLHEKIKDDWVLCKIYERETKKNPRYKVVPDEDDVNMIPPCNFYNPFVESPQVISTCTTQQPYKEDNNIVVEKTLAIGTCTPQQADDLIMCMDSTPAIFEASKPITDTCTDEAKGTSGFDHNNINEFLFSDDPSLSSDHEFPPMKERLSTEMPMDDIGLKDINFDEYFQLPDQLQELKQQNDIEDRYYQVLDKYKDGVSIEMLEQILLEDD